jgi:3D (Asp-Asp-Asp) domain-containing protein
LAAIHPKSVHAEAKPIGNGKFTATAYCGSFGPGSINGTGVTAGGTDLRDGKQHMVIAAGAGSGLKLGDTVSIEPNPFTPGTVFKVDDHGGAIFGHHIDIYIADCTKARQWGRKSVTVRSATQAAPDPVASAVGDAASAVADTATAIPNFVNKLGVIFQGGFWLRVAMALGGLLLIGLAVTAAAKQFGKGLPIPIPV